MADIIKASSHPSFGLFSIGHLGGENIYQFLTLHNLGLELATGSLQFLHTAHTLGLIARLPQLDLGLGLGQGLEGIGLPHVLILELLPQVLQVSGHHLVFSEERGAILALARDLVSSNWVDTDIFPLFMLAMAASSSSIWRERSWFSTCRRFLDDSASLRARAISSNLVLASTILPWISLPVLSRSALPLTASSRSARESRRSNSILALSFSDLVLLALRLSICSPRSAMVLLCFIRRAAKVPSWAMLSSSSSPLRRANSASLFLLSSTWVEVSESAASRREAMSSISFLSIVRLFSALDLFPRSTASSSSSSSSLAWSSLACLAYLAPRVASSSILAARALPSSTPPCDTR